MKRIDTPLPGVILIEPQVYRDDRGFFLETYHKSRFAEIGVTADFVQDNHSRSTKGTLRGLHYQLAHPQAKLCRAIHGEVLDVVVDIRAGSPAFGKHVKTILSSENKLQIYIPPGFAHGFLVLSESAEFLYKCSEFYVPKDQWGIAWNDSSLGIDWGTTEPVLSDKDRRNPEILNVSVDDLPRFSCGAAPDLQK
jgi:dTDP-4-dehydrorhamnose 3,5-epimerase